MIMIMKAAPGRTMVTLMADSKLTPVPDAGEIIIGAGTITFNETWPSYTPPHIVTVCGENGRQIEFVRYDSVEDMTYDEEVALREDNEFVKELYEQYRVALILTHKGKIDGSQDLT